MTASTVELGCVRLFRRLGLKRYTKNFKNYPQCWFADLNLSTPDTTARGYTAKRSSIYRRVILKTSWFSLQTDVRTRIVHFLKKLYNSPLLESIELPVLEADFFFSPFDFSKWISIISSSSVALALLRSLWAQIIGGQIFFLSAIKIKARVLSCAAQSSLSDSVSYCAERSGAGSRSQMRLCWCGAAWVMADGAQAIGVGGVLLSIRMVRGL